MPRLSFRVTGAEGVAPCAQPTVLLQLQVADADNDDVHSIALRAQVRIDPTRRTYSADEEAALEGVFGVRGRWSETLRPFLWTHATTTIPAFRGATTTTLPIVSAADVDAAADRYCAALHTSTIPLLLLFSGTVLLTTPQGLRADPVPWTAEARFDLPLSTWTAALDGFAPGARALLLSRDLLQRLERLRIATEAPTLAQALDRLVPR